MVFGIVLLLGFVTEVSVASIGLLAVLIPMWVTLQHGAKKKAVNAADQRAAMSDAIGTPNGRGNVIQMLERIDERSAATHLLLTEHLRYHDRMNHEKRPNA